MKRKTLLFGTGFFLIIISIIIYGYREYYRKPVALDTMPADLSVQATQLMEQYQSDENEANRKFLGKIVEVTGIITAINNQQDTLVNILLGNKEAIAHVSCSMSTQSFSSLQKLKAGTSVTIRGVCTGYLMDVELNRCVFIK